MGGGAPDHAADMEAAGQGVEYVEQGSRAMNPARLMAKMKRVEREFRIYGFSVAFTEIDAESTA